MAKRAKKRKPKDTDTGTTNGNPKLTNKNVNIGTTSSSSASKGNASGSGSDSSSPFPANLVPAGNRHLDSLATKSALELCSGAVFCWRNFFTKEECDGWVTYAESLGFEGVSHPATRFVAHRECGRIQRNDGKIAERLFERMKRAGIISYCHNSIHGLASANNGGNTIPKVAGGNQQFEKLCTPTYGPAGCNANIRIYKYEKGMSFGRHVDGSVDVDLFENGKTEMTVLVYLSSCVGGATRFYPPHGSGGGNKRNQQKKSRQGSGSVAYVPDAGSLLVHAHGDRCLEHEADPVEHGVKYVLRTDIVYGDC